MLAKEALNLFEPGDQGGTYTAQPLAMAAGLSVLKELLDKDIPAHAAKMGEIIRGRLADLSRTLEIENIRGRGLLLAFDLIHTKGADLVAACLDKGLLINAPKEKSIRLMPPLVATEDDIDQMFDILTPCWPGDELNGLPHHGHHFILYPAGDLCPVVPLREAGGQKLPAFRAWAMTWGWLRTSGTISGVIVSPSP